MITQLRFFTTFRMTNMWVKKWEDGALPAPSRALSEAAIIDA